MASKKLIACRHCDRLQHEVDLARHHEARCVRCWGLLYKGAAMNLDLTSALVLSCAILLLVSNLFPIAVLEVQDVHNTTTLMGAVVALYQQDRQLVAGLVLMTTIVLPALELIAMLYLLIPLRLGRRVPGLQVVFRVMIAAHPWSMMEVLMLGALITLVKLADIATILPGIALWSFSGLILLSSAVSSSFSVREFWAWVEQVQHPIPDAQK